MMSHSQPAGSRYASLLLVEVFPSLGSVRLLRSWKCGVLESLLCWVIGPSRDSAKRPGTRGDTNKGGELSSPSGDAIDRSSGKLRQCN